MTDLNAGINDLDLEYDDLVKDPGSPASQQIAREIPARYKDKSPEELIEMHVNLEKVLRRQGNDLGQLRRTVDAQSQMLSARPIINPQTEVKQEPITAEKLLTDPQGTVRNVVAQDPTVTSNAQRLSVLERSIAEKDFAQRHPDYAKDVQDPAFQEWVTNSPARSKLLVNLHQNYDVASGNDLWELWNEHKEAVSASTSARQGRVRQASTVKSGTAEPSGKPTYSRAKLEELHMRAINGHGPSQAKWNDPDFQREYLAAYAEDRVK